MSIGDELLRLLARDVDKAISAAESRGEVRGYARGLRRAAAKCVKYARDLSGIETYLKGMAESADSSKDAGVEEIRFDAYVAGISFAAGVCEKAPSSADAAHRLRTCAEELPKQLFEHLKKSDGRFSWFSWTCHQCRAVLVPEDLPELTKCPHCGSLNVGPSAERLPSKKGLDHVG